ncbi:MULTISPECIES: hypothetical protein [Aeromonas]|uniref:hypothetical protein n=1 Tax=Aeromonas simiae TaxID=218936 RepID=UPI0012EE3EEE|nr:hypothetical protein [Aeromonas simiae]
MNKFMNARISEFIDVESLLPKFETLEACWNEKKVRVKTLSTSSLNSARLLAEKLSDCDEDEPCYSLACPECIRSLRVKKISQLTLFCEDYTEWRIATFIYYDEMVRELKQLDISRLKDKLRKQLERAGVTDIVIGFFEVDYQSEYQRWMPHFHLLVRCKSSYSPEWRRFRKTLGLQCMPLNVKVRKRRPVLFQKLKHPLKQIAYICKFMWQRVEARYDAKDRRKTKKYRLSNNRFVDSLLKLNSLKLADLEFMYGVRQHGTTLKESVRGKR